MTLAKVSMLIASGVLTSRATFAGDGFDYPVGYPDAVGWNKGLCSNVGNPDCGDNPNNCGADALDFLEWNNYGGQTGCVRHPGEDWNKDCGGNCDCGEPVHAIADGVVVSRSDDCSWGATIIRHDNVPGYGTLWSVYGHMDHSLFAIGVQVHRGDIIGLVAMKGAAFCHLHLEIRQSNLGPCFFPTHDLQGADPRAWVEARYLNPTAFIASHRPSAWSVVNLHPAGATHSIARGVGGGQQVGNAIVGGVEHACLWSGTAASWVDLSPTGAIDSFAHGASVGQQVGQAVVNNRICASLWNSTAVSWTDLTPAGAMASWVYGVGSGQQVGTVDDAGGNRHAGLWTGSAASWVDLNPAGAVLSFARGAQGGQQVGSAHAGGVDRAGLWTGTAASWVDLHPAGASSSAAYGVGRGQQVGEAFVGGVWRASQWSGTAVSWVDLSPAGATLSVAYGVCDGQQAGFVQMGNVTHASLWTGTAESWVDLHAFLPPEFATQSGAYGIWNDATSTYVVGYGYNGATGRGEALMWVGPPPATPPCYPNCDGSTTLPVLNIGDFNCFLNRFAAAEPYANCDGSTTPPVLNVQDFACFLNAFAAGCS